MSTKKKKSTPDQFVAFARKEFGYLESDFGFKEDEPERRKHLGPRSISYSSPVAAVTAEGIQVTMNVSVTVICMAGEGEEPVKLSLAAIVDQRAPGAREVAEDLLGQVAHDAGLLRRYAPDLLRGGPMALAEAQRMAEVMRLQMAQSNAKTRSAG